MDTEVRGGLSPLLPALDFAPLERAARKFFAAPAAFKAACGSSSGYYEDDTAGLAQGAARRECLCLHLPLPDPALFPLADTVLPVLEAVHSLVTRALPRAVEHLLGVAASPELLARFTLNAEINAFHLAAGQAAVMREHVDPGLLTFFPFGVFGGFEVKQADGRWVTLAGGQQHVIAGSAAEILTGRRVTAVPHRVRAGRQAGGLRLSALVGLVPHPESTFRAFDDPDGPAVTGLDLLQLYHARRNGTLS